MDLDASINLGLNAASNGNSNIDTSTKVYFCKFCDIIMLDKERFSRHAQNHISRRAIDRMDNFGYHRCSHCGENPRNLFEWMKHRIECSDRKSFLNRLYLDTNMEIRRRTNDSKKYGVTDEDFDIDNTLLLNCDIRF